MAGLGLSLGLGLGTNQGQGYDAAAQAYFDALTSKPDETDKSVVNTFIKTLQDAGIWTLLDDVKLLLNWDTTAIIGADATCLFNMVNPALYKGVPVNTPITTKYTGVYGAGMSCIDTNFNMATAGVKASQNDIMMLSWIKTIFTENAKVQSGGLLSRGLMISRTAGGGPNATYRVNSTYIVCGAPVTSPGMIGVMRGGDITNGSVKAYVNGTPDPLGEVVLQSAPVENVSVAVLATKTNQASPTYASYCKDTLALHIIGRALTTSTDAKWLILYNAANTMITALAGRA